ncbi:DUF6461 domain-containing protein [Amycolatopsis sp. NPDC051372]|uniref:DUF6461 domain-containing protein n=1 Tax=Amycolatopsis sp. NPDC051372 TaxID=3155669 RepID=UPI0034322F0A
MGHNDSDRTAVAAHRDEVEPALVQAIVERAPQVAAAVPATAAAALGRWRGGQEHRARAGTAEPDVIRTLRELPGWLVERLHGALELTVRSLPPVVGAAAGLGGGVAGTFAFASLTTEAEALREARSFEARRQGAAEVIAGLVSRLVGEEAIAGLLGADAVGDEEAAAAAHGAAYLAVAVVTAAAVLGDAGCDKVAAQVGLGLGVASVLLRRRSMPVVYEEPVLAKKRVEYRLPAFGSMQVAVREHVFALAEGPLPEPGEFADNGLVEVVEGAVLVRTRREAGVQEVRMRVLAEPPAKIDTQGWHEVVEVSWPARLGDATFVGPKHYNHRRIATPPWPGDLRVRVFAYGRDDVETESYELVVWEAPPAPTVVHARADRLGHRLRGEPEPAVADLPEAAYRWICQSALSEAATVTVVVGLTLREVLQAFGADIQEPEPIEDLLDSDLEFGPWVTVSEVDGFVLAVEENGVRGAQREVLAELSRGGRAASMFWNVNAVTRLSFARDGELLASDELGRPLGADPEVTAAVEGLDFDDWRDRYAKGLVAVERFTGRGLTVDDLDEIEDAGMGYPLADR